MGSGEREVQRVVSCREETHQREEASNKLQNWKLIPLRATGGCVEHSDCKENRNRASWYKNLMSTFSPVNSATCTCTPHPRLEQDSSLKSFTIDSRFFNNWLATFPQILCVTFTPTPLLSWILYYHWSLGWYFNAHVKNGEKLFALTLFFKDFLFFFKVD